MKLTNDSMRNNPYVISMSKQDTIDAFQEHDQFRTIVKVPCQATEKLRDKQEMCS